jgi:hypothetical protein
MAGGDFWVSVYSSAQVETRSRYLLVFVLCSPDDTSWEGGKLRPPCLKFSASFVVLAGIFNLILEFTEDYPNKPPNVKFVTKMFHPNSKRKNQSQSIITISCSVYQDGRICLDILQSQWSPIYDVSAILTSIQVRLIRHHRASLPAAHYPSSRAEPLVRP